MGPSPELDPSHQRASAFSGYHPLKLRACGTKGIIDPVFVPTPRPSRIVQRRGGRRTRREDVVRFSRRRKSERSPEGSNDGRSEEGGGGGREGDRSEWDDGKAYRLQGGPPTQARPGIKLRLSLSLSLSGPIDRFHFSINAICF